MAGIEQEKLDAFYQLARIAVLISDPAGLERHFCELLKRLVSCNAVLVFHYVTEKRQLIAANPYNPGQDGEQSIAISEEEPFFAELLLRRKSALKQNSANPILPAMGSELFIPLISPFEILGILYVARITPFGFPKEEIQFLEHAAVNLTFALERESLRRQIVRRQTEIYMRQQSYLALLEAIPYPALVVDTDTDVCNEANEAARRLFGADRLGFIDKPFGSLCRLETEGERVSTVINGRRYAVVSMPLGELPQSLYLFMPPSSAGELRTAALFSTSLPVDWTECVKAVASALQVPIAVCRRSEDGRWQTIGAFHPKLPAEFKAEGLEEFLERAVQMQRLLRLSGAQADASNSISLKFGNSAPAAVAPLYELPYKACAVFFVESPIDWPQFEQEIHLAAAALSLKLLQKETERLDAASRRASLAAELRLFKKGKPPIDQLFIDVLKTMTKYLACDFVSFSLIQEGEFTTAFCTPKVQPFLPSGVELLPKAEAAGDWRLLAVSESTSEPSSPSIYGGLPFTLPAHYSTFILDGQNSLGRVALGRVKNAPFKPDERQLVQDVASALAEMLTGETESITTVERFAPVIRLLAAFKGDYWTEAWRNAVAAAVGDATVRFGFHNEADPADCIRMVMPEVLGEKISPEKAAAFLPSFAQDRAPLLLQTAEDAVEWFCLPETPLPESWRPLILTPVVHAERLAAVFSVSAGSQEQEERLFELLTQVAESLCLLFPLEELLRREFETGLRLSSVEQILLKLGGRLSVMPAAENEGKG
ncbi:MAG: PAS domain-containing protein [candidate division KSB1 bacterium]|nr:PAS domain-containing protein [candidate division KSB1 bacterium]